MDVFRHGKAAVSKVAKTSLKEYCDICCRISLLRTLTSCTVCKRPQASKLIMIIDYMKKLVNSNEACHYQLELLMTPQFPSTALKSLHCEDTSLLMNSLSL